MCKLIKNPIRCLCLNMLFNKLHGFNSFAGIFFIEKNCGHKNNQVETLQPQNYKSDKDTCLIKIAFNQNL